MTGAAARLLPDGRLHLQHGPIDLIIGAEGERDAVTAAFRAAARRFPDVLPALCAELVHLRTPLGAGTVPVEGAVARRMVAACWPHRSVFVTPMAAVAGAVADAILAEMTAAADLATAYVNNGGDVAVHLAPGRQLRVGLVADIGRPLPPTSPSPVPGEGGDPRRSRGEGEGRTSGRTLTLPTLRVGPFPLPGRERGVRLASSVLDGTITLDHDRPVRGLATSGWRGRSQSLGVADAVTVLAADAAAADAAATLVANAVDVDHPAVRRRPASEVKDDSDLGERLVTVAVGPLPDAAVRHALAGGVREAERMRAAGLIHGAVLALAGRYAVVGPVGAIGGQEPGSARTAQGRAVA
ncbi:UPF0280 family protein [Azospirillum sp. ST 5-10]|uniref:UPF0280 family protein n=1 Tax=unclassified Azospirillum TaxID=2630922 RepID=UPI003F49C275